MTNYLVQTRYHDVLPVLQTQPSDRRYRFRRVAIREAAIGLAGIVLTILVVSAVSSAGFGSVTQLGVALAFSAAVGTVTGYRLVPELDAMLEPQADDDGTKEQYILGQSDVQRHCCPEWNQFGVLAEGRTETIGHQCCSSDLAFLLCAQ